MTTTDRAALLRRAAEDCEAAARFYMDDHGSAAACIRNADDARTRAATLEAWAAELEAEPPWLDAPDGPGEWRGGPERREAVPLSVTATLGRISVAYADDGDGPTWRDRDFEDWWSPDHVGWRYQRIVPSAPVIVPPRESTP